MDCLSRCGDPCLETYFDISVEDGKDVEQDSRDVAKEYSLVYGDDHYVAISYKPKFEPIDILINMVNTMSLWRGTSFAFILSAFIWIVSYVGHLLIQIELLDKFKYGYHDHIAIIILFCKIRKY